MPYRMNMYRKREIGGKYIVTTDHGTWLCLDRRKMKLLESGNFNIRSKFFLDLKKAGIVVDEDNLLQVLESCRRKYSFLSEGTSLHIVIPTLRCNEKCVYCQAGSGSACDSGLDMDEETAKATVDFIFQSPSRCIIIEFQGGEPLLNFGMVRFIIEYALEKNSALKRDLHFSLVSNFSLMDEEKMKYLISRGVGLCTSLDGPERVHVKNRPFPRNADGNSYAFAVAWIRRLVEECRNAGLSGIPKVHALATITKQSLPDWKGIVDTYSDLGLPFVYLRFLNGMGAARDSWDSISYTAEEFIDFWKKSVDYMIGLSRRRPGIREWSVCLMLQKIVNNTEPNNVDQRSPCGAVIGQMAYNHNGDIFTCDEGRMVGEDLFRIGNVKENGYKEVTSSDKACCMIASSVNDTQICDACAYKPYCGICPVCNYVEQGSTVANISKSTRCKIFRAQFDYIFDKLINDRGAKSVFMEWLGRGGK